MLSLSDFRHKSVFASDTISINAALNDAITYLRQSNSRSLIVIDKNRDAFEGVLSDGDVRRFLLKTGDLQNSVSRAANKTPLFLKESERKSWSINSSLKIEKSCFLIPVLNDKGQVVSVFERSRSNDEKLKDVALFLMAGGRGLRLMPFTSNCPKPMLRVDGRPIIEHAILSAQQQGIQHIAISLGYLGSQIEKYFGDGRSFGVEIEYVREETPLGTAGALSHFKSENIEDLIVMNGDILTNCDLQSLLGYHKAFEAVATMGIKHQSFFNPFGVVNLDDIEVSSFEEKPVFNYRINTGIYMIKSDALSALSKNEKKDMPDFLMDLKNAGRRVVAFPYSKNGQTSAPRRI